MIRMSSGRVTNRLSLLLRSARSTGSAGTTSSWPNIINNSSSSYKNNNNIHTSIERLFGSWARRNRIRSGTAAEVGAADDAVNAIFDAEDEVEGYFSKLYQKQQREHDDGEDDDDDDEENMSYSDKQFEMRQALLEQRGRLWEDPMQITDEDYSKNVWWDDIPDWTPDVVSSTSLDRVEVLEHVPTLSELASTAIRVPPPQPVLPSADPKAYVVYRKQTEKRRIYTRVFQIAKERVQEIIRISDAHEQQDAVDELFESIEEQMKEEEGILLVQRSTKVRRKRAPPAKFEMMVEHALTEYLQEINIQEEKAWLQVTQGATAKEDVVKASSSSIVTEEQEDSMPLFVDFMKSTKKNLFVGSGVAGQIKEEWAMAALKTSQRVMLRQCMKDIAQEISEKVVVQDKPFKIFVQGRKGVGKSAVLNLLVASARESGYIVLFLPDGDRYRKNGKYVEPCIINKGMFVLPELAKEMCQQLLDNHGDQMDDMNLCATSEHSLSFLDDTVTATDTSTLTDLLRLGSQDVTMASGCYSCVVATLMEQTNVPFLVAMDEYNCYYEKGQYFHEEYDSDVVHPIPLEKISFFQPFLSIGSRVENSNMMKRGGVIAAITHNRSVAKNATEGLIDRVSKENDVFVVDVPRYSKVEVDHILANYECIGIGKLRFDDGKTVNDKQEVEFLRMMSGAVGSKLLSAVIWAIYA